MFQDLFPDYSEHFSKLLTINMENIMSTKLKSGQSLNQYIGDCIDHLLDKSYAMYKKKVHSLMERQMNFHSVHSK